MKVGRVFNSFAAAGLICAVSILSACGSGNSSNSNSSGSTASANSNANPVVSSPSPTPQIESFTADALIEALKKDRSEVDKRLAYEEISISGAIKVVDNHNVEFSSKDGGKVNCSSTSYDAAMLQKFNDLNYQASSKGGSPPLATATGTYKLSVPPDSKPNSHWYVGLNQCRIE